MPKVTSTTRQLKNKGSHIDVSIAHQTVLPSLLINTVLYDVVVVTSLSLFKQPHHGADDIIQLTVKRKYDDFEILYSGLSREFIGTILPSLPKKATFLSDGKQKELRNKLENFLDVISCTPAFVKSRSFLRFLGFDKAGLKNLYRRAHTDIKQVSSDDLFGDADYPDGGLFDEALKERDGNEDRDENEDTDENTSPLEDTELGHDESGISDVFPRSAHSHADVHIFSNPELGHAVLDEDDLVLPTARVSLDTANDLDVASETANEEDLLAITSFDAYHTAAADETTAVAKKISQKPTPKARRSKIADRIVDDPPLTTGVATTSANELTTGDILAYIDSNTDEDRVDLFS